VGPPNTSGRRMLGGHKPNAFRRGPPLSSSGPCPTRGEAGGPTQEPATLRAAALATFSLQTPTPPQAVTVQGFKVVPSRDVVTVDGRLVRLVSGGGNSGGSGATSERGSARSTGSSGGGGGGGVAPPHELLYFVVNKPTGYICRCEG
jgi:uncharacterized membrane protein YgcG